MSARGAILSAIKTPLGAIMMLVILFVLAGLSIVSAISGELTAAATSAAGFVVIIVILGMVNLIGK